MYNVLSHLYSPTKTLAEVGRILKNDGLFVLSTGNKGEFAKKENGEILGERWQTPEHLYHFSEKTLNYLLDKTGFKVEKLEKLDVVDLIFLPENLIRPSPSMIKTRLKKILLRYSFLRNLTKSVMKRYYFWGRTPCYSLTVYGVRS